MVLQQSLPPAASSYARAQRAEISAAVAAVRRQWRRVDDDFDGGWARVYPQVMAITTLAQQRVAAGALDYVPAVLEDTRQVLAIDVVDPVRTAALIGVAGDGRSVDSLLYGAVTHAKTAVGQGASSWAARQASQQWLSTAVSTLLSDTARQVEGLRAGASRRPVGGYVRMLQTPSCARCVVLAGKWFRRNQGFARHPRCDCRHIPASESLTGDLAVDPRAYFDSLSAAEQDKAFTKAGALAIREGADVGQVVNARRGMTTSQSGRLVPNRAGLYVTTEGTTSRGRAYGALRDRGTAEELAGTAVRITRDGPQMRVVTRTRATQARLMPESIAQLATDRDDYLRLLRTNGYL